MSPRSVNSATMTETSEGSSAPQPASIPSARSVERQQQRRQRAQLVPSRIARTFVEVPKKINPLVLLMAIGLVVFLAWSITVPARNYFEQKSELARIEAQIESGQREKQELTEELNRYNSEDYIREQARTRLGLIEPGETAFRLISPRIGSEAATNEPGKEDEGDARQWYQRLWDSVAIPEEETTEPTKEEQAPKHKLPTLPEEPAEQQP